MSACGSLWPVKGCGYGSCNESTRACECDPGWTLDGVAVDGVELCSRPAGDLIATCYLLWAVGLCANNSVTLLRLFLDASVRKFEPLKHVKYLSTPFFFAVALRGWLRPEWGLVESNFTLALMIVGLCFLTSGYAYTIGKQVRDVAARAGMS
jgi:hypothetical protein